MTVRRPWWKRKRWWAAVALWLAFPATYALGSGPILFAVIRGWVPTAVYVTPYRPFWAAIRPTPLHEPLAEYERWWGHRAHGLD